MKFSLISSSFLGLSSGSIPVQTQEDLVFPLVPFDNDLLAMVATLSTGETMLLRFATGNERIYIPSHEESVSLTLTAENGEQIFIAPSRVSHSNTAL